MASEATELVTLAAALYERRSEAVIVPRVAVSEGSWQPQPNCCHDNAAAWISLHTEDKMVHGWTMADYSPTKVRFFPHTVVGKPDGSLMDITPNPAPWQYPFIRHGGDDDDYARIVGGHSVVALDHILHRDDR